MNYNRARIFLVALALSLAIRSQAQSTSSSQGRTALSGSQTVAASVPRVTNFSGVVKDAVGNAQSGLVGITFSLYEEQEGGSPLWSEVQNVQLDERGGYTVLLGAMQSNGLPLDLFTTGKARWLGVQPQLAGVVEQPRVLLVGVPYALKAADADTLGGQPASAFMRAPVLSGSALGASAPAVARGTVVPDTSACPSITSNAGGSLNVVAKFDATCDIASSAITENGGRVGVGTTTPLYTLDVTSPANAQIHLNSGGLDSGAYLLSIAPPELALSGGASFNGSNWVAKATTPGIISVNGGIHFFTDAGLAVGNTYTPSSRMTISSIGYVGIGTTNPVNNFQVHTGTNQNFTVLAEQPLLPGVWLRSINDAASAFEGLQMDGAPLVLNALSGGNVGIGTSAPTSTLTVAGVVRSTTGGFEFPNGTIQTTATVQGPPGPQGPQGPPGPPGVTTTAICTSQQPLPITKSPCAGTTVSFTAISGQALMPINFTTCSVTATTGSCSAAAYIYTLTDWNFGACAVCK
jgi:hypothetical protein